MKLNNRSLGSFLAKPDAGKAGLLIYGADAMRVALKRQEVLSALLGPSGEEEMRLTRLLGADVRKEPATVQDGMRAQGFFPGIRVVFVEEANDALAPIFESALDGWQTGDAFLVVTAGPLAARAKLRKLFDNHRMVYSLGLYNDPPNRQEVEKSVVKAGLRNTPDEILTDLTILARELDPGDFIQTLEKLALYKLSDPTPLTAEDVQACIPMTIQTEVDEILHTIAEARVSEVGPVLSRLSAQGVNPTTLCINATRHFRSLHAAASHPQGPDTALTRARPPVFGPRKDRMARQARGWGIPRLESALTVLMDADLALRSPRPVPDMALVERAFIRIAMLRPK